MDIADIPYKNNVESSNTYYVGLRYFTRQLLANVDACVLHKSSADIDTHCKEKYKFYMVFFSCEHEISSFFFIYFADPLCLIK